MMAQWRWTFIVFGALALACGRDSFDGASHGPGDSQPDGDPAAAEESWGLTAWGELYEIFAEMDPLRVGETSISHTHVTVLSGFDPLTEGVVTVVLRSGDGQESAFSQDEAGRAGIFSVAIEPAEVGEYALELRVESSAGTEQIPAGQVRVGSAAEPGEILSAPAPQVAAAGEPVSFLKEQQWRTEFATAWVRRGAIRESVRGPARVRSVAGGEVILTAPTDGVVVASRWPFRGFEVKRAATLFEVIPRIAPERSLAQLEAEVSHLRVELAAATSRSERLGKLLELEATSQREVEEAGARQEGLEAALAAAIKDLQTARRARHRAAGEVERIAVTAPFAGRVARVDVTPGQAVSAGDSLARFVRPEPLWLEVALQPDDASRMTPEPVGLHLSGSSLASRITLPSAGVRRVASSPAVDPASGTVPVLLEVDATADELRLGSVVEAEILLPEEREGVVIPTSALVDDGGVDVVYVQVEGESFLRSEVEVLVRQGNLALVEGIAPRERLVSRGGNAIRRATLVATGPGEGHVH